MKSTPFRVLAWLICLLVPILVTSPAQAQVQAFQKISQTEGGFTGHVDAVDVFSGALANLGDLDGDGVNDLAVGAYLDDDGGADRGAVWILFLNTDGTVKSHQKISDIEGGFTGTLDNSDSFTNLGLAALGDLDGDGVNDLAVGARADDDGGADRGAVWILFLNTDGTVKSHQKISDTEGGFTGTLDNVDTFGSVGMLGDLDGDGVSDLIVGALADDDGGTNRGAVWILFLNTDGTVKGHQKISDTEGGFTGTITDNTFFGYRATGLGDLDGDGLVDAAVGTRDDSGCVNCGAVWILFLNSNGTVKSHQKISDPEMEGNGFAFWVSNLGDLDGDGVVDLGVGARLDDEVGTDLGSAWLVYLNNDGTAKSMVKITEGQSGFTGNLDANDHFGVSIESLGDLNGDGMTDLAVGADGDDDGGSNRGAVWVLFGDFNRPPTVEAGGPYEVDEGGTVEVTATGSDPDGDPITYAWDLDNNGLFETTGQSATFSALTLDGLDTYTIAVQATDSEGAMGTDEATVNVHNVAPTVGTIVASIDPVAIEVEVLVSAPFSDPGVPDTHTATWDWDDDTTSPGTVSAGQVEGSHTYTEAGVYTLTLSVTDDDGGVGTASFQYVVIYDPTAGFVTGGGWIDSPPGAYVADTMLAGQANFGFVSKYKKGKSVPEGETEFNFSLADLNFHSTVYEWLVIAGPKAQYKGSGTINGGGDYFFMLKATDEKLTSSTDEDLFRIKIWEKDADETVVYDNQIGAAFDSDAGTVLGGGSIVIHSGGNGKAAFAGKAGGEALPAVYSLSPNYPNPFNPTTEIGYALPEASHVRLVVYNVLGQQVAVLVDGVKEAGRYQVVWEAEGLTSGLYLYRIEAGDFTATKHMTLLK